jgi:hypothetical protein
MGWKASAIIINTLTEGDNFENILTKIGFTSLEKIGNQSVDSAIYPEKNEIYIGFYKGNLLITAQTLPLYLVNPGQNTIERRLTQLFPETEICAISLSSSTNHWAFAIIDQAGKKRIKGGDMDAGTVFDIGQPVQEELELLSKSKLNPKGEREYYLGDDHQVYREDQVGENFIFELFKRYTGVRLDEDDELFEVGLFGYKFQSFDGPTLLDISYCGEWSGYYTYGEGYRDSIKGKSSDFVIRMDVENGNVRGTSQEEGKEPAIINGFMGDDFIGFIHQYPVRYTFNDKGESVADISKPGSKILYSGLFDNKTNTFRGIWHIEGKNNWGEWKMKKQ